jgi:hypothetical protein
MLQIGRMNFNRYPYVIFNRIDLNSLFGFLLTGFVICDEICDKHAFNERSEIIKQPIKVDFKLLSSS